jgi:hypothetical protein
MIFNLLYQGIHEGLSPIGVVLVLPYSNLAALTRAAEHARLYQAFTGVELIQNHETELERGQRMLRQSKIS